MKIKPPDDPSDNGSFANHIPNWKLEVESFQLRLALDKKVFLSILNFITIFVVLLGVPRLSARLAEMIPSEPDMYNDSAGKRSKCVWIVRQEEVGERNEFLDVLPYSRM